MSGTTPALIAAAAGVGFAHAILPDHWVPLAIVGRTRHYPLARVARLSGLAGVAHVLISLLLGATIVAVGLQFRSVVLHAENAIVGGLLLATGFAFGLFEVAGRRHHHPHRSVAHGDRLPRGHEHQPIGGRFPGPSQPRSGVAHGTRSVAAVMIPFGAAASPDLTILPVFLAAAAVGAGAAIGSLVAFALTTVTTFVVLTVVATVGSYQLRTRWLDRSSGAITALVLVVIGALVASSVI